jgi:tripartite-type tricarboxylate transporter receptor subunit TctC
MAATASSGNGTSPHLAGELFKMMTDVDMVHVPYCGAAPALTDLIAGQAHIYFATAPTVMTTSTRQSSHAAVTTTVRFDALPNIPTVDEFAPGYEASAWYGAGVARNTPSEIVDTLKEMNAALADPRIKTGLLTLAARCSRARPPTLES